jgi:MFS family permease
MQQFERNILKYYIFSALAFTPFSLSVFVLFWQANGLDFFEIYLLQGIFSIFIVLLEVPMGMVADQFGKRISLLISTSTLTIAFLIYGTGHSFWSFVPAEMLIAVGVSLISGADTALLYDSLKKLNREVEYQKIEGRARAIQLISFAICNLIGGFIGSYSYRATVYLSAAGPFFALLTAFNFTEVNSPEKVVSVKKGLKSYKNLMFSALKFIKKHQLIRWQIIFSSVLTGSASWLLWLYQPYMQWSGLPVWGIGIAFALFNIVAAYASNISHRLEGYFSAMNLIIMFIFLQIAPLIFMSLIITPLSFLFILGHQAVRGISRPVVNDWILKYTFADKRATVLSINSMAGRLFFAITAPLMGYIANHTGYPANFTFQAALISLIFAILIYSYLKIPPKYFQIKDSVSLKQ